MEKKIRKNQEEILAMAVAGVSAPSPAARRLNFRPKIRPAPESTFCCALSRRRSPPRHRDQYPGYGRLCHARSIGALIRTVREESQHAQGHSQRPLPQRSRHGGRQYPGRGPEAPEQVEVTVNGVGERRQRLTRRGGHGPDEGGLLWQKHRRRTREILRTSKLVSTLTGIPVQRKAIVRAQRICARIRHHQDAVIKSYRHLRNHVAQELDAANSIVLGRHSPSWPAAASA